MSFRFYTNAVSQASRTVAAGTFVIGLLLIGFGTIIVALPEIFAYLFGGVFVFAGIGCGITAVKIFLAQRRLNNMASDDSQEHRENVRIHSGDSQDG
jgi:hypothetical protein